MTVGAFASDVTVGKEGVCFFVVILFAFLFHKFALIIELAEEVGSCLFVNL